MTCTTRNGPLSPEMVFDAQEEYPFVGGEFVWTGWDYLGEPTPFNFFFAQFVLWHH